MDRNLLFTLIASVVISSNIFAMRCERVSQKYSGGVTPLHISAIKGDEQMLSLLIDAMLKLNLSVDIPDLRFGRTPLHLASINGRAGCVSLLLDAEANVNAGDTEDENTALHFAAWFGHTEVLRKLLAASGVNPLIQNKKCKTPLNLAEENNQWDCADLLSQWITDHQ